MHAVAFGMEAFGFRPDCRRALARCGCLVRQSDIARGRRA